MIGSVNRGALLALAVVLLSACAVHGDWRLQKDTESVQYFEREYPGSAIPEFRAEVRIHASFQDVMAVLTDFSTYPDWVHRLRSIEIVRTVGFTEAYLYQVTELPVIRDRDMLMRGRIVPEEPGRHVVLELEAAPDYCRDKTIEACEKPNRSELVRVRESTGRFDVRQIEPGRVEVVWRQHLDPGGAVPAWATRLMLKDVPIRSLRNLKALAENSHTQSGAQ